MENKTNIAELLKDAPKGTKLYSRLHGIVTFDEINPKDATYSIHCFNSDGYGLFFTFEGKIPNYQSGECMLFLSKECRTWENKHFKAGQWVIAPYYIVDDKDRKGHMRWKLQIYSHYDKKAGWHILATDTGTYGDDAIIPYLGNEDKLGKEVG